MSRRKIPRETRVCAAPGCDTTFTVIITSKKKFCCSGHSRIGTTHTEEAKRKIGKANDRKVEIICPECGKRHKVHRYRLKQKHIFCSKVCEGRWRSRVFSGKNAPMFGKHPSVETRAKLSAAKQGKNHPMSGRHHSEATLAKMRKPKSKEGRKNIAEACRCPEKIAKQIEARKQTDEINGYHHSEKAKAKIGKSHTGKNHYAWIEDRSLLEYPNEFNGEFKEQIRERYNYICVVCKLTQEQVGHTLNVHHIDYDKNNLDPDNFAPLCNSCHSATNSKNNRSYWTKLLQKIVRKNYCFSP